MMHSSQLAAGEELDNEPLQKKKPTGLADEKWDKAEPFTETPRKKW